MAPLRPGLEMGRSGPSQPFGLTRKWNTLSGTVGVTCDIWVWVRVPGSLYQIRPPCTDPPAHTPHLHRRCTRRHCAPVELFKIGLSPPSPRDKLSLPLTSILDPPKFSVHHVTFAVSVRACPAGQFVQDGLCAPCPVNTYKPSAGNVLSCTRCPGNTVTLTTGSTSINDCGACCNFARNRLSVWLVCFATWHALGVSNMPLPLPQ